MRDDQHVASAYAPTDDANLFQRQLDALAAALDAEIDERQRLEDRLDELTAQLAALHVPRDEAHGHAERPAEQPPAVAQAEPAPTPPNPELSATERALIAAGVDPAEAARLKRAEDEFTLARMYLRDQAAREGWADTPRLAEELGALDDAQASLREEIGDDVYDRYLAAAGQPNRVSVQEVLVESPAAQAGLRTGDIVLRYGDNRIFASEELVNATRGGRAGEWVRLEVLREGERFQIDVPRGPLGLRIGPTHMQPDQG